MVQVAGMGATVNRITTEVRVVSSLCPELLGRFNQKGYPKYKKTFGKDQAMKILQNEKVRDLILLVCSDSKL